LILEFTLWRLNKAKSMLDESEAREEFTQVELDQMGEKSPLFRYTL
jgi:hypothetical protein